MSYPSYYTPTYRPPNGTLTSSSSKIHLRKIDTLAILTCLLLLRLAFTPSSIITSTILNFDSNIGASMELVFYHAFQAKNNGSVARPVSMDIDGDGTVDALVLAVYRKEEDVVNEMKLETLKPSRKEVDVKHDSSIWGDGKWGLRVINLKPLHSRDEEMIDDPNGPFAPRTMFLSPLAGDDDDSAGDVYPIKLQSVQIPIQRNKLGEEERSRQRHKKMDVSSSNIGGYGTNSGIPPKDELNKEYDRTRHYFCGRDWHHASSSCHRHCPGGVSTECNDGETCYADTPCDAMLPLDTTSKEITEETEMALTIRGTLPGITTIWSDGSVTLHAITADVVVNDAPKHEHRGKRERQKKKKPELEMKQMWRAYPLGKAFGSAAIDFQELGLTFESGVIYGASEHQSEKDGNGVEHNQIGAHGAIILGGRYTLPIVNTPKVSFHALDALTGVSLWELDGSRGSKSMQQRKSDTEPVIPIIHKTSSARRRSHLPVKDTMDEELDNENSFAEGDEAMTSEECMAHFRHSLFDESNGALPHEFWDGDRGGFSVGRFERVKKSPRKRSISLNKKKQLNQKDALVGRGRDGPSLPKNGGMARPVGGAALGISREASSSWQTDFLHRAIPQRLLNQQKHNAHHPKTGKPNVVIFHGRDGLAVLSLKNGRPVCHVSLVDNALYADIDRDGMVDVIQVVTPSDEFHSRIDNLIQRINKSENEAGGQLGAKNDPEYCHALVTSGLPPREEVFTAPLCLGGPSKIRNKLHAAPPLLIEGSLGYGNDVVFAVNNGVVVRYDFNGREVWRKKSAKDGTPSWHSDSVLLGRVQFGTVKSHSSVSASSHRNQHRPGSPVRPIVLSGEDKAAILSPANGKVLASVTFPQSAVGQPFLGDLNGDGTDDLCVVSKDAVWGYRIIVETGRSGFFSIVVTTLVIGVALSALIHKTNSHTSRRSMDA
ncbi:hypothetical protein ACHAXN_006567 [Cyclotella atomus]